MGIQRRTNPQAELEFLTETDNFTKQLVSINYHIIKACNYRCEFCYAKFNQVNGNFLPLKEAKKLIEIFSSNGTKKVTFVGGEPTLVPYLPELVEYSKLLNLTTMIVTNGTRITAEYLDKFNDSIDWIGLSIDTGIEAVSKKLGRGKGNHVEQTLRVSELLHKRNIKVKVNTVVTKETFSENMNWLIKKVQPKRWKVFQMLPISGENDDATDLLITNEEFGVFCRNHQQQNPIIENNEAMLESYLMIDPEGRFYSNSKNKLTHGRKILEVGIWDALSDIQFVPEKLRSRGGIYKW